MSLVLDAGGLTALGWQDRRTAARIIRLQQRALWPPVVPTAVLVESLTGHGPRDALVNRILRLAELYGLDEGPARLGRLGRHALAGLTTRPGIRPFHGALGLSPGSNR